MFTRPRLVILFVLNVVSFIICEPFELSVLHINDFHGRFDEITASAGICKRKETCIGGFSRLYKKINDAIADKPETIILNAGDDFAGTIWYTVGKWNITQQFMNKIKFDASALGNHEFEDGLENLIEYIKRLNHPMLVANLDASMEPSMQSLIKKSTVIERGGKKIGIIGALLSGVTKLTNTSNLIFHSESSSINEEAERLVREEGVFTNIVLSHCGYYIDQQIASNASEKISLIVGGHSHTFLYTGDNPPGPEEVEGPYPTIVSSPHGHKILIVQASSYCRYLGNITVYLDNNGEVTGWDGNPIFLDTSLPQDKSINQELQPWREKIDALPNPVVGSTLVTLSKWNCSKEECTLGNFVTDSMVYTYTKNATETAWTEAAIAVADTEGMRTDIEQGEILQEDLITALPYPNSFDIGEIQGSKLKEVFEFNTIREENGELKLRMLQVSGIKINLDITRPYGQRVTSIKLRCWNCTIPVYEDLVPEKMYPLVVDSYIITGGGNFTILVDNFINRTIGPMNMDIFKEYLQKRSPVYEETGTRIVRKFKSTPSSSAILKRNMVLVGVLAIILTII